MFGTDWRTSEPQHEILVDRDVRIPAADDIELCGDVFRPDVEHPVPLLIGFHPYNTEFQSAPIKPKSVSSQVAWIEGGDPRFWARRGYAHAIVNVRGTGKSAGTFRNMGPKEIADGRAAIDWFADREWCQGDVGLFGLAYFGATAKRIAATNPEPLQAIFAPWSFTDQYRDLYYHGGILAHEFLLEFCSHLDSPRCHSWSAEQFDTDEFENRITNALNDEEIIGQQELVDALRAPTSGTNPLVVDIVLGGRNGMGDYFSERKLDYEETSTPAYLGADWGHHAGHLAAAFRSWNRWSGPAKLLIGPDGYLDRPLYQLHHEALRWFDRWLKEQETGISDEAPIRLFERGGRSGWKSADNWPLPKTRWVPFYLHERGLLFERDHWPNEGYTTFEDSPFRHEGVSFVTPRFSERTEIFGPVPFELFLSTTDEELLLFSTLVSIDGDETSVVTRGWLRGSQRELRASEERWKNAPAHATREPLEPETVYRFESNLRETGYVVTPGERLCLQIACADGHEIRWVGERTDLLPSSDDDGYVSSGHLDRQRAARITLYHDSSRPSRLFLPVASGNILGTYFSQDDEESSEYGRFPEEKVASDERKSE